MKYKIRSFTLIEIVVALAISAIVLAIAYSCYHIVGNNFIQQKEKNMKIHSFHLLHSLISFDFNESQQIEKLDEQSIIFRWPKKKVTYQFEDQVRVLRTIQDIQTDTFFINFDNLVIHTLAEINLNNNIVNQLKVDARLYKKPLTLNFEKKYPADFYLKNENEY